MKQVNIAGWNISASPLLNFHATFSPLFLTKGQKLQWNEQLQDSYSSHMTVGIMLRIYKFSCFSEYV